MKSVFLCGRHGGLQRVYSTVSTPMIQVFPAVVTTDEYSGVQYETNCITTRYDVMPSRDGPTRLLAGMMIGATANGDCQRPT